MKSRDGKSQRREEKRRRKKIKRRENEKKEDPGARKGRKVATHRVFPMAKAAGAEPSSQMRDEKLHAVVAQSRFASKSKKNAYSDHFWKLRCRKSARSCGAQHISKLFGPLLEVEMSKKRRPL